MFKFKEVTKEIILKFQSIYQAVEPYIIQYITTFILFLSPIKGLVITMIAFVLFDTLYAIKSVIKREGWKSYQSHKLFNIVPKSFLYSSTILLSYLIDYFIMDGQVMGISNLLSKAMTFVWIYVEIKSIDETSQSNGNRPFLTQLKEISSRLKSLKEDLKELL